MINLAELWGHPRAALCLLTSNIGATAAELEAGMSSKKASIGCSITDAVPSASDHAEGAHPASLRGLAAPYPIALHALLSGRQSRDSLSRGP